MTQLRVLILALALPFACAAQPDAPVPRPEVKAGDTWTYRRMDYAANKQLSQYVLRVSFADAKAIHIVGMQRKNKEYDSVWTSEWNLVVHGGGNVFSPHRGSFSFPLRTGVTYRSGYEVANARRGPSARIKHERTGWVAGWEDVVVPAGKFRALKVEGHVNYQRLDNPRKGTSRDVFWYVPAVKRWVKYTYDDTNDLGRTEMTGEELVAFSVQ